MTNENEDITQAGEAGRHDGEHEDWFRDSGHEIGLGDPVPTSLQRLLEELNLLGGEAPTMCVPPTEPAARDESPGLDSLRQVERYELLGELGRGGMARVIRARDPHLGREVALKIVRRPKQGAEIIMRRFVREARILARLEHPGIAPIHQIGVCDDGRPFIAMRLVEGRSMAELLANRPGDWSDVPRLLRIFESVCQTVAFAHSRNVIHRDLKPANIMIGEFGVVRVMDWGIAKELGGDHTFAPPPEEEQDFVLEGDPDDIFETQHGTILGTVSYVPPEQAQGLIEEVDKRADVFTLGGMLCEILTGEPPFSGDTDKETLRLALSSNLDHALERLDRCDASPRLSDLARRCLHPQRDHRPPDARSVADNLGSILESNIRRTEMDLLRFFEMSLDFFCIASLDGYFRRVNSNFAAALGYSAEELVSRPFMDLVHPDDRAATLKALSQLNEGLNIANFRNRYLTKHGLHLTLEWTAKSVPADGVVYAVARDVNSLRE